MISVKYTWIISIIALSISIGCAFAVCARIAPFDITSDSMLSASLAVIAICTTFVVASQVISYLGLENKMKRTADEVVNKSIEGSEKKLMTTLRESMFQIKFDSFRVFIRTLQNNSAFIIGVSMLSDCIALADKNKSDMICDTLNELYESGNVKVDKLDKDMAIRYCRILAEISESATRLLVSLSH